jgi:hypothetical protein
LEGIVFLGIYAGLVFRLKLIPAQQIITSPME